MRVPEKPFQALSARDQKIRFRQGLFPALSFRHLLLLNLTLTAFSGFVDLLRLASDEGDMSQPVRCSWTIVCESLVPVRAIRLFNCES
jgi:transcriptional regulator GlxA family with amidase domain